MQLGRTHPPDRLARLLCVVWWCACAHCDRSGGSISPAQHGITSLVSTDIIIPPILLGHFLDQPSSFEIRHLICSLMVLTCLLIERPSLSHTHTHATTAMMMTTMMTVWLVEWNARSERLEACMEVLEGYVLHIMYNHKKLSLSVLSIRLFRLTKRISHLERSKLSFEYKSLSHGCLVVAETRLGWLSDRQVK